MAQNAFSPDAWTRARNRFVEDLTDEEQVCSFRAFPYSSSRLISRGWASYVSYLLLARQHYTGCSSQIVKRDLQG